MAGEQSGPQKKPRDMILEILESWPLYREFHYQGTLIATEPTSYNKSIEYLYLPDEIVLRCPGPKCKKEQRWTCRDHKLYARSGPLHTATYICNNCKREWIEYFLWWTEDDKGNGLFFKVGQYPALSIDPPSELKLNTDDKNFYKKALTSRNFSFGIGAVAYLRRVVEDRMNALLDLVVEAAKSSSGISENKLKEFERVRESRTVEDKVDFARQILPPHLSPGGHNPFDVLHDFPSRGLHRKSEEECLEIFDRVKLTFEYLFKNLNFQSEDAKRYARELSELASKKEPPKQ